MMVIASITLMFWCVFETVVCTAQIERWHRFKWRFAACLHSW